MLEPGETWRMRKSVKLDEAQASARSCAGRPDFLPCRDGAQSTCTTHSHGKCFKLHWCCLLGWCHCKYVYQPMTDVVELPSTPIPSGPAGHSPSLSLSTLLAERFLRTASCLVSPATSDPRGLGACPPMEEYAVTRIEGRAFYVPLARRDTTSGASQTTSAPEIAELRDEGELRDEAELWDEAELGRGLGPCLRSVLSRGEAPLRGETPTQNEASDQGLAGQKSRGDSSPSSLEDSGKPGVDQSYEDPEPGPTGISKGLNEDLNVALNEDLNEGLKEDLNEGRWDLPPLPLSGSLQDLAEALETTV